MNIREKLYLWRDEESKRRSVEPFRVLPNATLDEIALKMPSTKEQLCEVKGIKDLKFSQYGKIILSLVSGEEDVQKNPERKEAPEAISVSNFLQHINAKLSQERAVIFGEVTSLSEKGNAVYFSLRDPANGSVLYAFMWKSIFFRYGSAMGIGQNVIVYGKPEIYLPTGKLSLLVDAFELTGEGLLKKAYDELYKKLDLEGLFLDDRKKQLSSHIRKIGLITSKQGAVIHDFLSNLQPFGFEISFVDSRVEGILAVQDILRALEILNAIPLDVIVLVRGGGSLESLQAFNNEEVVRAIAKMEVPVMCSIGHDKDVPLAQLVADIRTSTPSLCTQAMNEPWVSSVDLLGRVTSRLERTLTQIPQEIERSTNDYVLFLEHQISRFSTIPHELVLKLQFLLERVASEMKTSSSVIQKGKDGFLATCKEIIQAGENELERARLMLHNRNPITQLKRGFSITRQHDMIVKSVSHLSVGDNIEVELNDGKTKASITHIEKYSI